MQYDQPPRLSHPGGLYFLAQEAKIITSSLELLLIKYLVTETRKVTKMFLPLVQSRRGDPLTHPGA